MQLAAISQALLALSHHVSMIFLDIFISQTDNVRGGSSHYYPFLSFVQPVRFSIANLNRKHNRINAFFFEKMPRNKKNPDSDLPSGFQSIPSLYFQILTNSLLTAGTRISIILYIPILHKSSPALLKELQRIHRCSIHMDLKV